MLKLVYFGLSLLMATTAFAGEKVKRTADEIKIPESSQYRDRYTGEGHDYDSPRYDENGWDYTFFPPEAPMNRASLMLQKSEAHIKDGMAAQKKECENPWPPIISSIEGMITELKKEMEVAKKLIKKYDAEWKKVKAELKTMQAEVDKFDRRDKIRPVTVGSYKDLNANQKKYWDYTKLKAKEHELGLWVVGLKEINGYRAKDLKKIEGLLKKAKAANKAWEKPKHCGEEEKKKIIKKGEEIKKIKRYPRLKAKCKKCEKTAATYNQRLGELEEWEQVVADIEKQLRDIIDSKAKPGESVIDESNRKKKETEWLRKSLKGEKMIVEARKQEADKWLKKLRACEKEKCRDIGMSNKYKYTSSKCKKCAGSVRQYNTFIDSMNSLQYDIDKYERKQKNDDYDKDKNETPGNVKFWLSELYDQLNNLKRETNKLAKAIKACERKCAPVEESKTDIRVGEEFEIELEEARGTGGTNAFDSKEVEKAGDDNRRTDTSDFDLPYKCCEDDHPPKQPPVEDKPKDEISIGSQPPIEHKDPPKEPFFANISSGGTVMTHIMGKSPCPDPVTTTQIKSSDNRPMKGTVINKPGFVNVSLSGQNSGVIGVDIKFNCNVPGPGTYSGTVEIKVTDPDTNESRVVLHDVTVTVREG